MDPDDFKFIDEIVEESDISNDISWVSITPSFSNINIFQDESIYTDISYGVSPEENNPAIYTSYEQREQHDKYPALKKAWEDYLTMFNLSKGEPPFVE